MVVISLPPQSVVIACFQIWCCAFFLILFYNFLMASVYLSIVALALIAVGLYHVVLPPVDDVISRQVIYGDDSDDRLPVYAHRGAAHDAPENTIAAFKEAKKNGADGVEFDLTFTKDNIAVLFHDDTVERTTDGSGRLSDLTFDEVRKLDAATYHLYRDKYKGEKIPTLEEGVEECMKLGLKIIFDVKEHDSRAITVVKDIFNKNKELYNTALVASFYPHFIYQLRRVDPNITTALTWRPKFISYDHIPNGRPRYKSTLKMVLAQAGDMFLDWSLHSWLWYVTGVSAVLIHKDCMSAEYVRMWRSRGIHVIAWTPNHHLEKEFFGKTLKIPYITDTMH